jgi:hypothetical protein
MAMFPLPSQKIKDWKGSLEAAKEYTAAQGEVVHAANLLQDAFFGVFHLALSMERPDSYQPLARARVHYHALAIWHIVQADGLQRDMALAAMSTLPTELKLNRAITALAWAKRRADRLAGYRNLIAHSPVMFRYRPKKGKRRGGLAPVFGGHAIRPVHASRLDLLQGLGFWRTLRNDLLKLTAYVAHVADHVDQMDQASRGTRLVGGARRSTWPHRPRLPSFARLVAIENQIEQATRLAKQGRRRRPSRV